MKWKDTDGVSTSGPYTIRRGVRAFTVSYETPKGYALVSTQCESLSQAKKLAEHDQELRERARA